MKSRTISRRHFVQALSAAAASISLGAVAACAPSATPGPTSAPPTAAPAPTSAPVATKAPAATLAPAATATQAGGIKRGGMLTIAVTEDTDNIDPAKGANLGFGIMGPLLGQPLVGGDPKDEIVPVLAEKFESPDNGRTWIFTLRKGVQFHNGKELTADLVKSYYDRLLDEQTGAQVRPQFAAMGVKPSVVDQYIFKVELTSGFGSFLSQLTQNSWTCILAPESFKPDGTIEKPIGTGPFVFESYKPGAELRFSRFDRYWQTGEDGKPLPYLDGLTIKIVKEATVRLSALRANEVDLITHAPLEDVKQWVTSGPPAGLAFKKYFYSYSDVLALNATRPPFNDPRARQAVQFAIDRESLNDAVFSGLAELHNQPFKKSSIWYLDVPYPQPDLDKARTLMKDAGLSGGADVVYSVWAPEYEKIAEVIQAQLAQIGFRVKQEKGDFGAWFKRGGDKDWDIIEWPFGTLFHPDQAYQYLGSNPMLHWIAGALDDPEIDSLLVQGRNEIDRNRAKDIYKKLVEKFQSNATPIFLTNQPLTPAYRDALQGFDPIDQGLQALAATNGIHKAWLAK